MEPAESVRAILSKLTGAPFKITTPGKHDPIFREHPVWFVSCPDAFYAKQTSHIEVAWEDSDGNIWLGSRVLADVIDWVEMSYGETGSTQSMDLDYTRFDDPQFQVEFTEKFPIIIDRIRTFENIAKRVSLEHNVRLEIKHSGLKGMLDFFLASKIEWKQAESEQLEKEIARNVNAMKEAYDEIANVP